MQELLRDLKRLGPVLLVVCAVAAFIIYSLDILPLRHPIPYPYDQPGVPTTAEAIDNADAIVEGAFLLDRTVSSTRAFFTSCPYGPNLKVNTFTIPFQIDHSLRGPSSGTVNVKL